MNRLVGWFEELRRRDVFRAATFYSAGAWLVVEVLTQLVPVFGIPAATIRWVVIAGIAGFPFAILFSWLYTWTPEGIRRESEIDEGGSSRHLTGRQLDYLIIAVLAVAIGLLLVNKFVLRPRVAALAEKSIAVLPLLSEGRGADEQSLADGLTENLISALAQFDGLKVISRSSAFRFRDRSDGSAAIGRKLGVAHLLDGSVRREGDQVRIVLELIKVADGSTEWSQRYDRPYRGLFALQDEIAMAVARALKGELLASRGSVRSGDRPPSENLEAYNAFLQGKFYESRNTEADFRAGLASYARASALDRRYAAAYAAYSLLATKLAGRYLQGEDMQAMYARAQQAASTAQAIDPRLAEAHLARGRLLIWKEFNWTAGAAEYRRALQLAPDSNLARTALADVQATLGQPRQAEALARQALATDVLNAQIWHSLATFQMALGEYDQAEQSLRKAAELQPGMNGNQEQLAIIAILRGQPEQALQAANLEHAGDWRDAAVARALQLGSDHAAADAALANMIEHQAGKAAYQIAQVQALRNDPDAVFLWLDRAWQTRDAGISMLLYDPLLSRFRDDPRFAAFCRKVGLPVPTTAPTPQGSVAKMHKPMAALQDRWPA